jgi:hypothetical protein
MIYDELQCVFVEVPKTGASSIRHIAGHPHKPLLNIAQIAQSMSRAKFSTYFKFGFV